MHSAEAAEVEAAEGTEDSYPSSHMLSVENAYNYQHDLNSSLPVLFK